MRIISYNVNGIRSALNKGFLDWLKTNPADVICVLVRENNAIELLGRDATLLQTQNDLPRAQTAINENFAMIGGNQRAVSRAPAAEHGQAEHGSQDTRVISFCANEMDKSARKL